jgi:trans-aconitate methyltransferase
MIRQLLLQASLRPGGRLLDLGCGPGDFLVRARLWFPGVECSGMEMSAKGVEIARRKLPGISINQVDLIAGAGAGASEVHPHRATHAVCSEVLEHVDEPVRLLRGAAGFLSDRAWLIVTVPGGPKTAYDKHIGHRSHFTRRQMAALLSESGFEVHKVAAAGFPFHNLYRLLVLVRGSRVVEDAGAEASSRAGYRSAVAVFDTLFRLNFPSSPWGWQIVGLARKT